MDNIPRCPDCGAKDIRSSFAEGLRDSIMLLFQMTPFRCRACTKRFYRRVTRTAAAPTAASEGKVNEAN